MTQKLTMREIAKVFSMYLGCSVTVPFNDFQGFTKTLQGIVGNTLIYEYDDDSLDFTSNISKWRHGDADKMHLQPLSSITDEQVMEIGRLCDLKPPFEIKRFDLSGGGGLVSSGNRSVKVYFSGSNPRVIDNGFEVIEFSWPIFQYLISEGYAVPLWFGINHWANNKTAIELGIAVDSTTQKVNS